MKRESGWKIEADKESETESGFPTTTLRLTATTTEEAAAIVSAALKSGATRITITDEDRAIRDGLRAVRLSGQVEIEGEPGWRCVKQHTASVQHHAEAGRPIA